MSKNKVVPEGVTQRTRRNWRSFFRGLFGRRAVARVGDDGAGAGAGAGAGVEALPTQPSLTTLPKQQQDSRWATQRAQMQTLAFQAVQQKRVLSSYQNNKSFVDEFIEKLAAEKLLNFDQLATYSYLEPGEVGIFALAFLEKADKSLFNPDAFDKLCKFIDVCEKSDQQKNVNKFLSRLGYESKISKENFKSIYKIFQGQVFELDSALIRVDFENGYEKFLFLKEIEKNFSGELNKSLLFYFLNLPQLNIPNDKQNDFFTLENFVLMLRFCQSDNLAFEFMLNRAKSGIAQEEFLEILKAIDAEKGLDDLRRRVMKKKMVNLFLAYGNCRQISQDTKSKIAELSGKSLVVEAGQLEEVDNQIFLMSLTAVLKLSSSVKMKSDDRFAHIFESYGDGFFTFDNFKKLCEIIDENYSVDLLIRKKMVWHFLIRAAQARKTNLTDEDKSLFSSRKIENLDLILKVFDLGQEKSFVDDDFSWAFSCASLPSQNLEKFIVNFSWAFSCASLSSQNLEKFIVNFFKRVKEHGGEMSFKNAMKLAYVMSDSLPQRLDKHLRYFQNNSWQLDAEKFLQSGRLFGHDEADEYADKKQMLHHAKLLFEALWDLQLQQGAKDGKSIFVQENLGRLQKFKAEHRARNSSLRGPGADNSDDLLFEGLAKEFEIKVKLTQGAFDENLWQLIFDQSHIPSAGSSKNEGEFLSLVTKLFSGKNLTFEVVEGVADFLLKKGYKSHLFKWTTENLCKILKRDCDLLSKDAAAKKHLQFVEGLRGTLQVGEGNLDFCKFYSHVVLVNPELLEKDKVATDAGSADYFFEAFNSFAQKYDSGFFDDESRYNGIVGLFRQFDEGGPEKYGSYWPNERLKSSYGPLFFHFANKFLQNPRLIGSFVKRGVAHQFSNIPDHVLKSLVCSYFSTPAYKPNLCSLISKEPEEYFTSDNFDLFFNKSTLALNLFSGDNPEKIEFGLVEVCKFFCNKNPSLAKHVVKKICDREFFVAEKSSFVVNVCEEVLRNKDHDKYLEIVALAAKNKSIFMWNIFSRSLANPDFAARFTKVGSSQFAKRFIDSLSTYKNRQQFVKILQEKNILSDEKIIDLIQTSEDFYGGDFEELSQFSSLTPSQLFVSGEKFQGLHLPNIDKYSCEQIIKYILLTKGAKELMSLIKEEHAEKVIKFLCANKKSELINPDPNFSSLVYKNLSQILRRDFRLFSGDERAKKDKAKEFLDFVESFRDEIQEPNKLPYLFYGHIIALNPELLPDIRKQVHRSEIWRLSDHIWRGFSEAFNLLAQEDDRNLPEGDEKGRFRQVCALFTFVNEQTFYFDQDLDQKPRTDKHLAEFNFPILFNFPEIFAKTPRLVAQFLPPQDRDSIMTATDENMQSELCKASSGFIVRFNEFINIDLQAMNLQYFTAKNLDKLIEKSTAFLKLCLGNNPVAIGNKLREINEAFLAKNPALADHIIERIPQQFGGFGAQLQFATNVLMGILKKKDYDKFLKNTEYLAKYESFKLRDVYFKAFSEDKDFATYLAGNKESLKTIFRSLSSKARRQEFVGVLREKGILSNLEVIDFIKTKKDFYNESLGGLHQFKDLKPSDVFEEGFITQNFAPKDQKNIDQYSCEEIIKYVVFENGHNSLIRAIKPEHRPKLATIYFEDGSIISSQRKQILQQYKATDNKTRVLYPASSLGFALADKVETAPTPTEDEIKNLQIQFPKGQYSNEAQRQSDKRGREMSNKMFRQLLKFPQALTPEMKKTIGEFCAQIAGVNVGDLSANSQEKLAVVFNLNRDRFFHLLCRTENGVEMFCEEIAPSLKDGCHGNLGSVFSRASNRALIKDEVAAIMYGFYETTVFQELNGDRGRGGDVDHSANYSIFNNAIVANGELNPCGFVRGLASFTTEDKRQNFVYPILCEMIGIEVDKIKIPCKEIYKAISKIYDGEVDDVFQAIENFATLKMLEKLGVQFIAQDDDLKEYKRDEKGDWVVTKNGFYESAQDIGEFITKNASTLKEALDAVKKNRTVVQDVPSTAAKDGAAEAIVAEGVKQSIKGAWQ